MSSCDCDGPSAFTKATRKARKEHWCFECHDMIRVGDVYVYQSGVWDGRPDSFRTCVTCDAWGTALAEAIREGRAREAAERRRVERDGTLHERAAFYRSTQFDYLCDCWVFGGLGEALGEFAEVMAGRP